MSRSHCCPEGPWAEKGWKHHLCVWGGCSWCGTEEIISAENGKPLSCDRKDFSDCVILDYFCSSVYTCYFKSLQSTKGVKIAFKDKTSSLISLITFLCAQATTILTLWHKNSTPVCKMLMHHLMPSLTKLRRMGGLGGWVPSSSLQLLMVRRKCLCSWNEEMSVHTWSRAVTLVFCCPSQPSLWHWHLQMSSYYFSMAQEECLWLD